MHTLFFARGVSRCAAHIPGLIRHRAGWLLYVLLVCAGYATAQVAPDEYRLALNKIADGQSPTGWVAAATQPSGPLAQWRVGADTATPGGAKVLTIERIQDKSSGVFNLYWTKQVTFQNGELSVRMRANSGNIDQGGGLMWRVRDENNYYVARFNPLESNLRLYYVKQGSRTMLASSERLLALPGEWVQLRIAHHGQRIQGWFNKTLAWEISDVQLPDGGGVGLWSKADAASSFADFVARSKPTKYSERLRDE